jgi:hypothetical protein
MAHGKWSEVEARGVLEAWHRTDLSLENFAKQRGIVPQRLRWWRHKLEAPGQAAGASPVPALLPVRMKRSPARGEPVTVLLRTGHMLKVSHGFDEEAFARVVALLEGG